MHIETTIKSALENYQAGNLQQAENDLKNVLKVESNNTKAINLLGIICYQLKRYNSAIQYMSRLINLDPYNAQAYYIIGNCMQEKGQVDEAATYYQKTLQLDANFPDAYYNLGTILQDKKRNDEAISCYQKALKINPTDTDAYYNLGRVLQDTGRLDEAMTCYQKALQINPNLADAYYNLGNILQEKRQADEAMICYQKALETDPTFYKAYHNIGSILQRKGQFDEAINSYQKALGLNANDEEAYVGLGYAFQEKGQLDEAITCYHKAIEINPSEATAYINLAAAYQNTGHNDKAREYFKKASHLNPDLMLYNNLFLMQSRGVIHVGANFGQERDLYKTYGLNVVWIEPIPEVFDGLKTLIHSYPNQKAFCYLVTDIDDGEYLFHVSNNEGQSSSIYDLADHKEIWPDVTYSKTITLKSITLSSLIKKEHLEMNKYDTLILDTQGSELLILKGAISLLPYIEYVKAEVADFESYAGCCKLSEMDQFFEEHNFRRIAKVGFAYKEGVGAYYDVLYVKIRDRQNFMPRKLHIGGNQKSTEWEILNVVPGPYVDHLCNARDLSRFSDNTFTDIYASHVLEHFDYINELEAVLKEWYRVLMPGGTLYISVPDLDVLAHLITLKDELTFEERFSVMRMIFGGHIDRYDYHAVGLNQDFLTSFLANAGFANIQKVHHFGFFNDTNALVFKGVPISLNMIAVKPIHSS
jgi:FkbM family methyltransferase